MVIQENQSTFDLAIQLNGTLDDAIYMLAKYQIKSFDEDLTAKTINAEFNTKSNVVNTFYVQSRNIVTSDSMPIEFQNFVFAEYDSSFSRDFDSF